MDITQFVMAYGVEQDRLSPPAADGGKRRRHPLLPGAGSLLRVLHPAGLNPPPAGGRLSRVNAQKSKNIFYEARMRAISSRKSCSEHR